MVSQFVWIQGPQTAQATRAASPHCTRCCQRERLSSDSRATHPKGTTKNKIAVGLAKIESPAPSPAAIAQPHFAQPHFAPPPWTEALAPRHPVRLAKVAVTAVTRPKSSR